MVHTPHDIRPSGSDAEADGWSSQVVNVLSAAEDLLDALEAAGFAERELHAREGSGFLVRWR